MDYAELIRNIAKAGLSIKDFANLIKANPNSITNLSAGNKAIPKNVAIIAVLLGEMVDKGIGYKHLFEKLHLNGQKARRDSDDKSLFKQKNSE